MTDLEAVNAVLKGETETFRILVDRYKDKLYGLCLRLIGDEIEAQDVLQDSFVEIYKHLGSYKFKSSLSTWMYTITYRMASKSFKEKHKRPIHLSYEVPDVQEQEEESIDPSVVRQKAANLKPVEYNLFELYYMDNLSVSEICEVTSFSSSKIKSMLMRIRKKLKQELEKELYGS